ncbi:MAG: AAA family ATPase [Lachnospiraceae bacterium]|nr:AAA family ATPase [Lachnospiraceae bacterium]
MESRLFEWIDFYKELTEKLLLYKDNRAELILKVKQIYTKAGIKMPKLDINNNITDFDPFSFFGLFNKKMSNSSRCRLVDAVKILFDVTSQAPHTFESIPVLNPLNSTYYCFANERTEEDIPTLWVLFENALKYAKDPTEEAAENFSKYFDIVINMKGIGNSKLTMGLFWIAPECYLNLDSRNTWYIYESGRIPKEIVDKLPHYDSKITANDYFEIERVILEYLQAEEGKVKDFKELSYEAWIYSTQVNEEQAEEKKQLALRENSGAAVADEGINTVHYWIYSPGDRASMWEEFYNSGIMAIGWDQLGDLNNYASKAEIKNELRKLYDATKSYKNVAHATWQFANEMKPGDVVFAKKGMYQVIGRGIVESDYEYDPARDTYRHTRKVNWTHRGEWPHPGAAAMKFLTDITPYEDYVEKLNSLFENETDDESEEDIVDNQLQTYVKENFLKDVYMSGERYDELKSLLMRKKNVIIQGAPGVGKTYLAKRLAYSIIGEKDPSRVMMVQFHQSYSYEDFIMGYRPNQEGGFDLRRGPFYEFCKSAEIDSDDTPYFFIIDEINRGNLSKIFGELFMLIEDDKRDVKIRLLYADENFSIPKNVYIIGMMNTADRSLAIMDYALRRRFAFFDINPAFDNNSFTKYQHNLNSDKFDSLINCIKELNSTIASDETLGAGFCIGHSYFCNISAVTDQLLKEIVEYELAPLLREYWFDDIKNADNWIEKLRRAIN